jgi:uncharacterized membrane protein
MIYGPLHTANIVTHVAAGSLALLCGVVALLTPKGGRRHRQAGRIFLYLLAVVVMTGLFGVFIFKRNAFLLVITLLSGYLGYSGFRIIKLKNNRPHVADIAAAIITLVAALYFLYYLSRIGMMWSPVVIYSTVGYLFVVIAYDLARYLIPARYYRNGWLYEHIVKMVSAFSGLLSAFSGTVFPQFQPYSQILPSVLGTAVYIGFMIFCYRSRAYIRLEKR